MVPPGLNATDDDIDRMFINGYYHFVHLARKRKFGKKLGCVITSLMSKFDVTAFFGNFKLLCL